MTDKNYTSPEFNKEFFTCPHCDFYMRHEWFPLKYSEKNYDKKQDYRYVQLSGIVHITNGGDHGTDPTRCRLTPTADICDHHNVNLRNTDIHFRKSLLWASKCEGCFRDCIWGKGNLIYPDINTAPPPNKDLSREVKKIYKEAASAMQKSPRATAALLRLAIEKICIEQGCKEGTLERKIHELVAKDPNLQDVLKALDTVRIVGNKGAHAGIIELNDHPDIVASMFEFINFIAERLISDPQKGKVMIARAQKIHQKLKK